jgi:hypothetical protein
MPLRIVGHLSVNADVGERLIQERLNLLGKVVRPARLELATSWFVDFARQEPIAADPEISRKIGVGCPAHKPSKALRGPLSGTACKFLQAHSCMNP